MRVAVVLTGQPRYLEQSAWWWKNKIFPPHFTNINADYFMHIWDDKTGSLDKKITETFNPKKYIIGDYNVGFHSLRHEIKTANTDATDWEYVTPWFKECVCFNPDTFDHYQYNTPGMFLSAAESINLIEDIENYDIIIKTRTDCVIRPGAESDWLTSFKNILSWPAMSNSIFVDWMHINSGLPFIGDLVFIAKATIMKRYLENLRSNLIKLATVDKILLNDFNYVKEIPETHWLWTRLSIYSKTNWDNFNLVSPSPFATALIRHDENITNKDFTYLQARYNEEERRRRKS
jgi:hypothetical protein